MTLRRPQAMLTIDGQALTGPEAAMTSIRVDLGAGAAHDGFAVAVMRGSPVATASPGAAAEIGLGYGDSLQTVLTGEVTAVARQPWGALIEGLGATIALSRVRIGRSYVGQSVASIVDDLVASGEGTSAQVAAPLELSVYHVDERQSVWSHLGDLAALAGCEVTSDPAGGLNFRALRSGPADHTLRGGAEVLTWFAGARAPGDLDVGVVAYGAASEQGSEKWHLLLKEPDGSAGSAAPALIPGAVRAREGAQALADARAATTRRRAARGVLTAVGDATIRPGDLIELTDMPAGEDATLRATAVTHILGGESGFVTVVRAEASA